MVNKVSSESALIKKLIFEIVFIGLLILTGFIVSRLNYDSLLYLLILLFFISFIGSILGPQFSFWESLLFSAILPATIFILNFKKLNPVGISLGFFLFWIFFGLAFALAKKEEKKTIEISFSRVFKNFWTWLFLGIFFFAFSVFYFQNKDISVGNFFLPKEVVFSLLSFSQPFLKEIDKDIDLSKNFSEYLSLKKVNLFGIDVHLPAKEIIEDINKKTNSNFTGKEPLKEVFYSLIKSYYEALPYKTKQVIFIALILILLFFYESIIIFAGTILGILANFLFYLLYFSKILKITAEPRGKEKISF